MLSVNRWLATAILTFHAGLLAYLAARHSPTIHEMAHLPAGICHWQFGMFELYRVNPPLPRMVAALPVLFCNPQTDWGNYQLDPLSRETIPMGVRFAKANGARTIFLFMIARWACIPFCLLGGWVCYRWGSELWGMRAGLMALCLWCFNPMILGHGAVVMPDVPGAAMGVLAAWRYWKWLREPVWSTAALAGLTLGLAELCKTTLLVFFILWPLAWLAYSRHHAPRDATRPREPTKQRITRSVMPTVRRRSIWQLAAILLLAIYLINVGYAFKGSCQRLGDYRFQSRLLSGQVKADPPKSGNRFAGTWVGHLPIPLPRDYVQGIDCQRNDFEVGGRSYFYGRWEPHGWWFYYLVGLGIKTPLGTMAAVLITGGISLAGLLRLRAGNGRSPTDGGDRAILPLPPGEGRGEGGQRAIAASHSIWPDELFLLAPGLAILALVSTQTGFSAHVRYAIPALPYLFIWCGKTLAGADGVHTNPKRQRGRWHMRFNALPRLRFGLVSVCLVASALESLAVYPHSLSFFNLSIGGPSHGHEWLLDSNGPWGQDLLFLKEWVDRHPEARPLHLASVGWLDPQVLGIDYTIPPVGPSRPVTDGDRERMDHRSHHAPRDANQPPPSHHAERDDYGIPQGWEDVRSLADLGPKPGWYVVDANFLHGTNWSANSPGWGFQRIAEEGLNYEYFRLFDPCDRVGYSYLVYHISGDEAHLVRRELKVSP